MFGCVGGHGSDGDHVETSVLDAVSEKLAFKEGTVFGFECVEVILKLRVTIFEGCLKEILRIDLSQDVLSHFPSFLRVRKGIRKKIFIFWIIKLE